MVTKKDNKALYINIVHIPSVNHLFVLAAIVKEYRKATNNKSNIVLQILKASEWVIITLYFTTMATTFLNTLFINFEGGLILIAMHNSTYLSMIITSL